MSADDNDEIVYSQHCRCWQMQISIFNNKSHCYKIGLHDARTMSPIPKNTAEMRMYSATFT